jgi:hypothetical protein
MAIIPIQSPNPEIAWLAKRRRKDLSLSRTTNEVLARRLRR